MQPQRKNIKSLSDILLRIPTDARILIFLELPYRQIMKICKEDPELGIGICENEYFWYEKTRYDISTTISKETFDSVKLSNPLKYLYFIILGKAQKARAQYINEEFRKTRYRPDVSIISYLLNEAANIGNLPIYNYIYTTIKHFQSDVGESLVTAIILKRSNIIEYILDRIQPGNLLLFSDQILEAAITSGNFDVFTLAYRQYEGLRRINKPKLLTYAADIAKTTKNPETRENVLKIISYLKYGY